MKRRSILQKVWLFTLPLCITVIASCGPEASVINEETPEETIEVSDKRSLETFLGGKGSVQDAGPVSQPFFSPKGSILLFNDAALQVFEYPTPEIAADEADLVRPDGSAVGSTNLSWVDPPHFYRKGRVMVLYIGNDEQIKTILKDALGEQFAGM